MQLIDLRPNWTATGIKRNGMGVSFCCPCRPGCDQRLVIWFVNPIDDGPPAEPEADPKPRWVRQGTTFLDLSVYPSVDFSKRAHWHGHITNGQVA